METSTVKQIQSWLCLIIYNYFADDCSVISLRQTLCYTSWSDREHLNKQRHLHLEFYELPFLFFYLWLGWISDQACMLGKWSITETYPATSPNALSNQAILGFHSWCSLGNLPWDNTALQIFFNCEILNSWIYLLHGDIIINWLPYYFN